MSKKNRDLHENRYDKYSEHLDETPLGKLQQQYWTTKQQVIKKLGKKEDEFVVLSDAELDSKLELFEAIGKSSMDLLKVIEMYQEKLIVLSIEEGEMSSFLKSQSTYDTKTKAGKMMAAVAKAQHFAAQQHTTLRLPLVRLYNEVETFRYRAFTDTFLTVRKMEQSRTEYRGALLWMKNISMELDPDASRKLEKFRRVQAQVKKTKTKFDRLKTDAIQKIDLLSASRCNMFSHVLVNYQRTLLQFWEKTARTFNAVADSFKGYQFYEFNVIKDLIEPSKRLAEIANKSTEDIDKSKKDEKDSNEKTSQQSDDNTLISLDDVSDEIKQKNKDDEDDDDLIDNRSLDKVNELIDLMTLNEAHSINEQLKELEQLEEEKKKRNNANNNSSKDKSESIKLLNDSKFTFDFNAASISKIFARNTTETSATPPTITKSPDNLVDLEFDNLANSSQSPNVLKSFKDLLNSKNDEFEREWQSAFSSTSSTQQQEQTNDEFGNFVTATPPISGSNSHNEIQSLFTTQSLLKDQHQQFENKPLLKPNENEKQANSKSSNSSNNKNMSAWYDLFAELDPLKNPDAIGNSNGVEDERNC